MSKEHFQSLIIILCILLLGSCNHRHKHNSILHNQTGKAINLEITFSRAHIEEYWAWNYSYIPTLKQYGITPDVTLINFDTLNLIGNYAVKNQGEFIIDQGTSDRNNKCYYSEFDKFKVLTDDDSIVLQEQKDFEKYFIESDKADPLWTLK